MKLLRYIWRFLRGLVVIYILYLNVAVHYQPHFSPENRSVVAQLRHLKVEMHEQAALDMQQVYPEGFIFLNALYGLTWADIVAQSDSNSQLYHEGIREIDYSLSAIESENGTAPFNEQLSLPYGAFYNGWHNYLLSKKLMCISPNRRETIEINQFKAYCTRLSSTLKQSKTPFLASYTGAYWPADMVVCMAAFANYEKLFDDPRYQTDVKGWIQKVAKRTDDVGLIPHATDAEGEIVESSRGSSQSLMLCFLPDIDSAFASVQFAIYKSNFLTTRLGLYGVREYPLHNQGTGDIDSGPVIWGVGGAASIVGQRAFAQNGDKHTALSLRNAIEAFGMGATISGKKKYLLGVLPIADAFIAWSNASEPNSPKAYDAPFGWAYLFHFYAVLICCLLFFSYWRTKLFT